MSMPISNSSLRVLTWHIHGNYLYYLAQTPVEFYLPVKTSAAAGYGGRAGTFPWPENVHDVPAEKVKDLKLDCILFQSRKNYFEDQFEILTEEQRHLPSIYLEHDPPQETPTDTHHWVDDPQMLLVHVTHFNNLMWDSGRTPTRVIQHGVLIPNEARYTGELERGIVVINELKRRGRRLGADVYSQVRQHIPLDLVGMKSDLMDGLGEVNPPDLPAFEAHYRFFFNPIRYTSLGLAVCEAMMVGLPIVGLATTEMVMVVENGVTGFIDTDVRQLMAVMQELIMDPELARCWGKNARQKALECFNISRFTQDWLRTFQEVCGR